MSGYNLENIEELIAFDADCASACCECPQNPYRTMTFRLDQPHSIAGRFLFWFDNELLWKFGYDSYLSEKALETFDRYSIFRDGRIIDFISGKCFDPSDFFIIGRKYVRTKY